MWCMQVVQKLELHSTAVLFALDKPEYTYHIYVPIYMLIYLVGLAFESGSGTHATQNI